MSPQPRSDKPVGNIMVKKTHVQWDIENFSIKCADIDVGQAWKSHTYDLGDCRYCYLKLYPKGKDQTCKDFMSVYAVPVNGEYEAQIMLYIWDINNDLVNDVIYDCSFEKNNMYGCDKFIKTNEVLSSRTILFDDKISIVCEISDESDVEDVPAIHQCEDLIKDNFQMKKLGEYEELFESKRWSDVKFIIGGKIIQGHKNIIGNKNPVFRAMFELEMRESGENEVKIDDISYDVMNELLRFVYVAKVKNIDRLAKKLLVASEKYMIEDLKLLCEKHMSRMFTFGNIVENTNFACLHNASHLRSEGIKFIIKHTEALSNVPDFDIRDLDLNVIQEVFQIMANPKKRKLEN
ncbi:hypothetical protein QAD02_004564 [Eretmocerus hayati]|uniref:Uncharacterized protein n=1 Tax=Eretmocerus hayati TaxID=131215 RepID=A0ACC2NST8_9HYME|nr:hypothetical protein QAD02_004564 [Eretmocerus hayati]